MDCGFDLPDDPFQPPPMSVPKQTKTKSNTNKTDMEKLEDKIADLQKTLKSINTNLGEFIKRSKQSSEGSTKLIKSIQSGIEDVPLYVEDAMYRLTNRVKMFDDDVVGDSLNRGGERITTENVSADTRLIMNKYGVRDMVAPIIDITNGDVNSVDPGYILEARAKMGAIKFLKANSHCVPEVAFDYVDAMNAVSSGVHRVKGHTYIYTDNIQPGSITLEDYDRDVILVHRFDIDEFVSHIRRRYPGVVVSCMPVTQSLVIENMKKRHFR